VKLTPQSENNNILTIDGEISSTNFKVLKSIHTYGRYLEVSTKAKKYSSFIISYLLPLHKRGFIKHTRNFDLLED
jgi:hypothetical protein